MHTFLRVCESPPSVDPASFIVNQRRAAFFSTYVTQSIFSYLIKKKVMFIKNSLCKSVISVAKFQPKLDLDFTKNAKKHKGSIHYGIQRKCFYLAARIPINCAFNYFRGATAFEG